MRSVLKPWVSVVPLQMQGVLVAAVRGPDGITRECAAKDFVRAYRAVILVNALDPRVSSFQGDGSGLPSSFPRSYAIMPPTAFERAVEPFFKEIDAYPHHWLLHFAHAAEIVGYELFDSFVAVGPDDAEERERINLVAGFWREFYWKIAENFHMTPETRSQMSIRLCGDGR